MIPVSLSGGVEPGARTGTSVGGQQVVLWRGQDGAARAWTDRCPHRGMRLSFGYVRDNALTCIYHGWSFGSADGTGEARCLAVPAHPEMTPPPGATVAVLPLAETLGMIWVGIGPQDDQPPHAAVRHPQPVYPVRSITAAASADALRAALEATLPPGTETAETTQAPGIIVFKGPATEVIAAIQDRGDGATSAHVVTTDPGPAARRSLCLWAALVRDHLAAVAVP